MDCLAMKRLLTAILCLQVITSSYGAGLGRSSPAETSENSDITVIKIKPIINTDTENTRTKQKTNYRSSRIENLPLQIKPIVAHPALLKPPEVTKTEVVRTPRSSDVNKTKILDSVVELNATVPSVIEDENNESEVRFDLSEAVTPYPTDSADYKSDTETTTARTTDANTDLYKKSYTNKIYALKNKYSKKYYYGSTDNLDPTYRKYVETRRFRSRCRCERIWNCPKLQLSVPRCPEEYFMCCF